jgi:hypothetical protein
MNFLNEVAKRVTPLFCIPAIACLFMLASTAQSCNHQTVVDAGTAGAPGATGGAPGATGGAPPATGGSTTDDGKHGTGGARSSTGGKAGTGGKAATGGSRSSTGGKAATGGTSSIVADACELAGQKLTSLNCTQQTTPKGVPFATACRNAAKSGLNWHPECIFKATKCTDVPALYRGCK